jgi:hypothetical protein
VQPVAMNNKILLASYPQYNDAQAAVDRLSDAEFPVEETAIVGRDLRLVENVTGRLTRVRAAAAGAASGAWFGLLFGLFLGIFAVDTASTLGLAFWGLFFGTLAGAVFGLVTYALSGGKRDFVSATQIVADRYDVVVDARTADDARRILGFSATTPSAAKASTVEPSIVDSPDRTDIVDGEEAGRDRTWLAGRLAGRRR